MTQPRTAIVHDWLTGMRGGEAVLEAILELYPQADLLTLIYIPGTVSPAISQHRIMTSPLQHLPFVKQKYRHFLPLMPAAVSLLNLRDYDLVISSSHCVAKGIRKGPRAKHISYVHAPMRYMWDRFEDYFGKGRSSRLVRAAAKWLRPLFQSWDRRVSAPDRVDGLIANSHYIAKQIGTLYQRNAAVIYPFADAARFQRPRNPKDFYLIVSAFAPYKQIDLAIQVFNRLRLPLKIVGGGQDESRLKKMAGETVEFLGKVSNDEIAKLYSETKAFLFPGQEDFGITPVEAMAAGAPVIAYAAGGALETVTEKTGLFFSEQTVGSFSEAVQKLEAGQLIREEDCRTQAALFSKERFQREFQNYVRQFDF